jgi:hypothetical protein
MMDRWIDGWMGGWIEVLHEEEYGGNGNGDGNTPEIRIAFVLDGVEGGKVHAKVALILIAIRGVLEERGRGGEGKTYGEEGEREEEDCHEGELLDAFILEGAYESKRACQWSDR